VEDWNAIAGSLGYDSEREMFHDLYLTERMSINELAQRLGFGRTTIRRRLARCEFNTRGRGGANNLSRANRILHYSDQRLIFLFSMSTVAKRFRVHNPVIWRYRKSIKGGKVDEFLRDKPSVGPGPLFESE